MRKTYAGESITGSTLLRSTNALQMMILYFRSSAFRLERNYSTK
jgi:hypothetical protein